MSLLTSSPSARNAASPAPWRATRSRWRTRSRSCASPSRSPRRSGGRADPGSGGLAAEERGTEEAVEGDRAGTAGQDEQQQRRPGEVLDPTLGIDEDLNDQRLPQHRQGG